MALQWHQDDLKIAHRGTGTVTCDKPSNVSSGDLLIAFLVFRRETITAPTGWTLIRREGSTDSTLRSHVEAYYKIAGSSEPATYDFTVGNSNHPLNVAIGRVTGHKSSGSPIENENGTNSGSTTATNFDLPSLSVGSDGCLLFGLACATGKDINEPASMTRISRDNNSYAAYNASYEAVNKGNTGVRNFSWSGGTRYVGLIFNVLPDAGATNISVTPPTAHATAKGIAPVVTTVKNISITTLEAEEIESSSAILKCELVISEISGIPEVEVIWNE